MDTDSLPCTGIASAPGPQPSAVAAQLTEYAQAAQRTADKCTVNNDDYGHALASTRANVYRHAADLVRQVPLRDAAVDMMRHAQAMSVRTPPLIDFDFEPAGIRYMTARAWQFCAWQIDPSLPEVAPRWAG